jgi:hypothetical protein
MEVGEWNMERSWQPPIMAEKAAADALIVGPSTA